MIESCKLNNNPSLTLPCIDGERSHLQSDKTLWDHSSWSGDRRRSVLGVTVTDFREGLGPEYI